MARRKGRAEAVRAYWREVRAFAKATGRTVAEARKAPAFRASYQATGKAPKPKPPKGPGAPRGGRGGAGASPKAPKGPKAPRGPSRGSKGLTTGGRSKSLRSYWDFVNAYAAQNRIKPGAARNAPGFQRAYERYREGLRDEERARRSGAGDEAIAAAKGKQLDALAQIGMLSREEVAAKKASPKMRIARSARGSAV